MPGLDGVEFLRHLAGRQTPPAVIVLSGQDRSILNTVVQLGRAHGLRVLGSVSKPFTLAPLKALLEDACAAADARTGTFQPLPPEAYRAGLNGTDRQSVGEGEGGSVRVVLGGRRIIK